MDLISVVIPVYNAEKYLAKAVDSAINQTYQNLEIILVDDGSKDNSPKICDEYKNKDPRIKVIHQVNKGLSGARNAGIKIAKGKYIAFLDSDDYVDKEMYTTLHDLIVKEDADIACSGVEVVNDEGHVRYYNDELNQLLVLSQKEAFYYHVISENKIIATTSCDKLYKKEIVEKKLFVEGAMYEDLRNMAFYISQCHKIVYINKLFYKYYYNQNSLTHGKFNPKWYTWIDANNERVEVYKQYAPEYLPLIYAIYVDNVLSILYKSRKDKNNKELRKKIMIDLKECLKNNDIPLTKKAKFKLKIYKISKHLFYFLMRLYDFTR